MKGYKAVQDEFMSQINAIVDLGIGVLFISHAENILIGEQKSADGSETIKTYRKEPTIPNKKIKKFVLDMVDCCGYITSTLNDDGSYNARLHLRETPEYLAGSHFRYMPADIPFNYDALQKAIIDSVKKEANSKGQEATETNKITTKVEKDFDQLINEFNEIVGKLKQKEDFATNWAPKITEIVNNHLGKGNKISSATRDQYEAVEAALGDLKDIAR